MPKRNTELATAGRSAVFVCGYMFENGVLSLSDQQHLTNISTQKIHSMHIIHQATGTDHSLRSQRTPKSFRRQLKTDLY